MNLDPVRIEVPIVPIVNVVRCLHGSSDSCCRLACKRGVQGPTSSPDLAHKEELDTLELVDSKAHVGVETLMGIFNKSILICALCHKHRVVDVWLSYKESIHGGTALGGPRPVNFFFWALLAWRAI